MNSHSNPKSFVGRSLGDRQRYRLEKRLGGGGMGDVFLAMDTRIGGKQVALKLLKDTLVSSPKMRKRFEREVEICGALNSKHIVQVTDCGVTDEGYPFYVMEYLRGESLRQLIQREHRLSVERAVKIVTQTCQGLQRAHQGVTLWRESGTTSEHIQVVHRDLKPDNIFLETTDEGEVVKIVDFGIAKIRSETFEQTSLTHAFIGTFRYAAPEQLRGEINLDGRADIYSLGIILYEMLSGSDPFGFSVKARHHSESSWIIAHTSEPPTPLRSQLGCGNLSPELEAVVMRCLQKNPSDRFSSVEELTQALQAAVNPTINHLDNTIPQRQLESVDDSDQNTTQRPINQKSLPVPIPQPVIEQEDARSKNLTPVSLKFKPQPEQTIISEPQKSLPLRQIISVALISGACISGFFAYPLITSMLTLNSIKQAQAKSNYQECIASSEKVSSSSSIYQEVVKILNQCLIGYATKLAEQNQCVEAMQTIEKIPQNNILEEARKKIDQICTIGKIFTPPR